MGLDDYSTGTDPRTRSSWCINDEVIRLREWAGEHAYILAHREIVWVPDDAGRHQRVG